MGTQNTIDLMLIDERRRRFELYETLKIVGFRDVPLLISTLKAHNKIQDILYGFKHFGDKIDNYYIRDYITRFTDDIKFKGYLNYKYYNFDYSIELYSQLIRYRNEYIKEEKL